MLQKCIVCPGSKSGRTVTRKFLKGSIGLLVWCAGTDHVQRVQMLQSHRYVPDDLSK